MKTKFGAIVVDGRGKLGGHVFSKNASGSYMRTKTTPTNPQTAFQTQVRLLFAAISTGWSALTETVRNSWIDAVAEWQTTDIFGDLKKPTGKALYQRLNNQAQSAGWPAVTTPPAKAALPDAIVTGAEFSIGAGTLTMPGIAQAASVYYEILATTKLSQGINFVKNKLRVIENGSSLVSSDISRYTSYVTRFGNPVIGDNIYVGIKYVLANGQASPVQIIKTTIVA